MNTKIETAMSTDIKTLDETIACQGLTVRTTNQQELNPATAKLATLWLSFYQNIFSKLPAGSAAYGIYHNYESDAHGAFDVTASCVRNLAPADAGSLDLKVVTIPTGKYLVFSEQGAMPIAVITAWQKVWAYFNDPNCEQTRLYNVDFEHYISQTQVDVYIGIE